MIIISQTIIYYASVTMYHLNLIIIDIKCLCAHPPPLLTIYSVDKMTSSSAAATVILGFIVQTIIIWIALSLIINFGKVNFIKADGKIDLWTTFWVSLALAILVSIISVIVAYIFANWSVGTAAGGALGVGGTRSQQAVTDGACCPPNTKPVAVTKCEPIPPPCEKKCAPGTVFVSRPTQ